MSAQARSLLLLLLCGSGWLHAQVSVVNEKQLTVPPGRPEVIYHSALQVMQDKFAEGDVELRFPVTVVLGEEHERYTADENRRLDTIYLESWNENKFAVAVMRLALEHLLDTECRNQLLGEILRRSDAISPVAARPTRR